MLNQYTHFFTVAAVCCQIEEHLSKLPAGSGFIGSTSKLTSADFMMIFGLESILQLAPQWMEDKIHTKAWVDWVHARCVLPSFM